LKSKKKLTFYLYFLTKSLKNNPITPIYMDGRQTGKKVVFIGVEQGVPKEHASHHTYRQQAFRAVADQLKETHDVEYYPAYTPEVAARVAQNGFHAVVAQVSLDMEAMMSAMKAGRGSQSIDMYGKSLMQIEQIRADHRRAQPETDIPVIAYTGAGAHRALDLLFQSYGTDATVRRTECPITDAEQVHACLSELL